jgi:hypothetical protein
VLILLKEIALRECFNEALLTVVLGGGGLHKGLVLLTHQS